MAARLRKGDLVVIIAGKEKGNTGKIKSLLLETNRVLVEGLNLIKRHTRPTPRNPNGGIVEKEAPIHASNVMPVDPKTGKGTRVKFKSEKVAGAADANKTRKVRVAKSGEELPVPSAE